MVLILRLHFCAFLLALIASPVWAAIPPIDWGQKQLGLAHLRLAELPNKPAAREPIVAVIDTGIDPLHPDLLNNLWTNPGETGLDSQGRDKRTNGIDDDGNGFVDDVHGWNFAGGDPDISDQHGHGTHISGLIAGQRLGVAPRAKIMVLKYYDTKKTGRDHLRATIEAIRYATRMNAQIINYSGGGLLPHAEEMLAIKEAAARGILFVAAAGNERANSDTSPYYPADYKLANIVSVTALDPQRRVLASSNYGKSSVDIAAPGENILSTLPGGQYGIMTGTSQATAFVSGAAALLLSESARPLSPKLLIQTLVRNGDKEKPLQGKTKYGVKLNPGKALASHRSRGG